MRRYDVRWLVPLCAATLFLGSALLFTVQPMMGRMVLPLAGGAPAVWTTCLMFFQAALLGGYLYAHVTSERFSARAQAIAHAIVLLVPLALLPPSLDGSWGAPDPARPIPWLLLRLFQSVGLPFIVVAANAPLVQRWFAASGHKGAADPYFLYAASNLGSLAGLLSYPLLIEPRLTLARQSQVWTLGYAVLVVATWGVIALTRSQGPGVRAESALDDRASVPTVTTSQRLRWLVLAFVPSTLMISVTTYISIDVAAVPLLWVVPLGMYLVTFILSFSPRAAPASRPGRPLTDERSLGAHRVMVAALPIVFIPPVMLLLMKAAASPQTLIPLHLLALFVAAMVCHRELFRARPPAGQLTSFYLWIAAGGVAGGIFAALVAPALFRTPLEYPLTLVLAALCRPSHPARPARSPLDMVPIGVALIIALQIVVVRYAGLPPSEPRTVAMIFLPALMIGLMASGRPRAYAAGLAIVLAAGTVWPRANTRTEHIERNFFGVQSIELSSGGRFRAFIHGNTLHGTQALDPSRRHEATTYYTRSGPAGEVLSQRERDRGQFAVVGLGAGTLASYARPGQHWTFYEINPAVERLAGNPAYFTYLSECGATCRVVLGDARLTLVRAPDATYDVIVLDAFNSDAIPIHLLTREALREYLRALAPAGVVLFHVSNRFLDLRPVIAALAADAGLATMGRTDVVVSAADAAGGKLGSSWAVVARSRADLGDVANDPRWRPLRTDSRVGVWTDDFSNIFAVLSARRGGPFASPEQ